MTNLSFAIILVFSNYFLGYQNNNMFYHICTGKHPAVNINRTRALLSQVKDQDLPEWFNPDAATVDPLELFSNIVFATWAMISSLIFWYSYKHERKLLWKSFKRFAMCRGLVSQVGSIPTQAQASKVISLSEEKFEEKNNQIVGKGQALIIFILSMLSLLIFSVSILQKQRYAGYFRKLDLFSK